MLKSFAKVPSLVHSNTLPNICNHAQPVAMVEDRSSSSGSQSTASQAICVPAPPDPPQPVHTPGKSSNPYFYLLNMRRSEAKKALLPGEEYCDDTVVANVRA